MTVKTLIAGFFLAIAPISELRGAIPFLMSKGYTTIFSFIFSTLSNFIVIPLAFSIFSWIENLARKSKYIKTVNNVLKKHGRKKHKSISPLIENIGLFALTIFTAVPLPFTGAWTACLIAHIARFHKKKSATAITLGILIAGIIVTATTSSIMLLS